MIFERDVDMVFEKNKDIQNIKKDLRKKMLSKALALPEIYKKDAHAHGTTLNIKETFVNTAASGQDVRIKVTVVLDHDQNTIEKEVTFKTK